MRSKKYPSFSKQPDTNTGTFSFIQLRPQLDEQRFDISPLDINAARKKSTEIVCYLDYMTDKNMTFLFALTGCLQNMVIQIVANPKTRLGLQIIHHQTNRRYHSFVFGFYQYTQ